MSHLCLEEEDILGGKAAAWMINDLLTSLVTPWLPRTQQYANNATYAQYAQYGV